MPSGLDTVSQAILRVFVVDKTGVPYVNLYGTETDNWSSSNGFPTILTPIYENKDTNITVGQYKEFDVTTYVNNQLDPSKNDIISFVLKGNEIESTPPNYISIRAYDHGSEQAQLVYYINYPPSVSNITDQTINKNASTSALSFTVRDPETAPGSLSVTATSSNTTLVPNNGANLTLGGNFENRTLTVTPAANQSGTATITVTVQDEGGLKAKDTFLLTVTDPPTVSDITNVTINKNAATSALSFTVGDAETAPGSLSVTATSSNTTLVPNNGANLTLGGSGADRTLTVTPAANQSGTATITLTVSDEDGLTAQDTFVLTVNDPPTVSDITNVTVNENGSTSALSFTVGDAETAPGSLSVTATSSNTTLVPNNGANLTLGGSGANRTLTVTPAANQSGTATITVTVSDGNGGTAQDTFVLTVNGKPSISNITDQAINKNTATSALSFTVGDAETAPGSLSVTATSSNTALVPNNESNLTLGGSGADRTLKVTPAANQSGTATITLTVSDEDGLTVQDTFVLTVNDPPTVSDITNVTVNENGSTSALSFTVGDAETAPGSLSVSTTSSNTTLVPNNGANLTLGGSGANRTLTVTPAANQSGTATITITVSDGNGGTAQDTFVLTVNGKPSISNITDLTMNKNGSTSVLSFTVGDAETSPVSLSVTATSSNTTLVPNNVANLKFGGSGAYRTLTVTPAANQIGTGTITVTVQDEGGLTAQDTFVLTVNDPPTISDITNVTVNENGSASALSFTVGDAETAPGSLSVTATSSNTTLVPNNVANLTLGGSGANRTLTVTPAANRSGTATITVTVSDGNGGTAQDTFVLTVNGKPSNANEKGAAGGGGITDDKIEIIVDGVTQERSATIRTTKDGDKTVTTIVVDNEKVLSNIMVGNNSRTLTIPFNGNSNVVIGEMNGQLVKALEGKDTKVVMKTERGTYTLPADQINMDIVSAKFGQDAALKDIKISITIAEPASNTVRLVQSAAGEKKITIMVQPVEFEVKATYNGHTLKIDRFTSYVQRMIPIPDDVDYSKITTGVVLDTDGKIRHVPTKVVSENGKFYAIINSLSNSVYSVVSSPKTFADVENHWSKADVNDMGSRMIIEGVSETLFEPDKAITRAEFAAIIVRAMGLTENETLIDRSFTDVRSGEWYQEAIQLAAGFGLVYGDEDGSFRPNESISRVEAMAILSRAMKLVDLTPIQSKSEAVHLLSGFKDADQIGEWAVEAVASTVKQGIVQGYDQQLKPHVKITRAQTAVMVRRLLQKADLING
nr:Ig-like domain-containing protein [Cohnella sp. CFH 77786]